MSDEMIKRVMDDVEYERIEYQKRILWLEMMVRTAKKHFLVLLSQETYDDMEVEEWLSRFYSHYEEEQ
jgi:hypothetical protein